MEDNSAIFEGLNPEQHRAVAELNGPALIVAGAGSGKTRVITCRIANLLFQGVPPGKILALTFTRKAAKEMTERVAGLVGSRRARGVVMGTFHSIFIRFLKDYADFLGYPEEFTIYDTSDSISLIKTCLKQLNLDDSTYKPKAVLSRISDAKNNLVTPAAYLANNGAVVHDRCAKMPRLCEVYDLYWRKCREAGVMDFDDILFEMNILFRDNPAALQEISSRFEYVLVDEYQDTNRAQYIIVKKMAAPHHNVCVVGDDSQSIYAFRGAKIENILNFQKDYADCRIYRLEQNYRSTKTIVEAANTLISHNEGRIPKNCFSEGEKGSPIRLIKAFSEQEEASLVVGEILRIIQREHVQYQDFAILYRTNSQSRLIEDALRRRNIPYIVYSGNSFFDRQEVRDLMAYFKLAVNPRDDESFKRAVNKPARGIGDTSLAVLSAFASARQLPLMEAAHNDELVSFGMKSAAVRKIRAFCEMMSRFHEAAFTQDAYELARQIAFESGLWMLYKSDLSAEGQARFGNVEELCNSVKEYVDQVHNEAYEDALAASGPDTSASSVSGVDETHVVTLAAYLENVALISAVDVDEDGDDNKVKLMTAHSSKGLEFPYVFVIGMEENLFPGGGQMATPNDVEEERRLFYVAMTRAMKGVQFSFASSRVRNGKSETNPVSRFIREISSQYIENPLLDDMRQVRAESFWASVNNVPKKPLYRQMSQKFSQHTADSDFEPSPVADLRMGQRVEHNRFGAGLIRSISGDGDDAKVIIRFDDFGEKTLLLKFAKIRII